MVTFISHSPAETEELGLAWGRRARPGLVVGLSGDLGAGKTVLVKGVARGLAITTQVRSPTFNLINIYTGGRLTLYHLDLYRLRTAEEVLQAGLEEYLRPDGVTVIEWAERWFGETNANEHQTTEARSEAEARPEPVSPRLMAARLFPVQIETLSLSKRRITYEAPGP